MTRMFLVANAAVFGVAKEMSLIQQRIAVDIVDYEYDYDASDAGKGKGKESPAPAPLAAPTPSPTETPTPDPTPVPTKAPTYSAHEAGDECIKEPGLPGWNGGYTCQTGKPWCTSWQKDMHRCCPNACNVAPLCSKEECEHRPGSGSCNYPNPTSETLCGPTPAPTPVPTPAPTPAPTFGPGDECIREPGLPGWNGGYTCETGKPWCTSWQKDMHRCCPGACNVQPLCSKEECDSRPGSGSCNYPNAFSEAHCPPTPAPTPVPTPAPTPPPTYGPGDECIREPGLPGWNGGYTCETGKPWCTSWQKDMHRCCPEACGVQPLCTKAECDSRPGSGSCNYPNAYSRANCGGASLESWPSHHHHRRR